MAWIVAVVNIIVVGDAADEWTGYIGGGSTGGSLITVTGSETPLTVWRLAIVLSGPAEASWAAALAGGAGSIPARRTTVGSGAAATTSGAS